MKNFRHSSILAVCFALAALVLAGVAVSVAQTLPAGYIRVDAPFAQRLIVETKTAHPEIVKLGLHATPPAVADNVIIASDAPAKVGKKSSPSDMEKLALHQPSSVRIEKDQIYDLLLPITDDEGGDLGNAFVVMEVPFARASSETEALKIGIAIRDELQKKIPSQAALYRR